MRRLGGVLLVVALLAAGGYGLMQLVNARDDSEIATPSSGPGEAVQTACGGEPSPPARDRRPLSQEQIDALLTAGNVVIEAPDPSALAGLQEEISGRYDPEFALAGQMVVLAASDDGQITAHAWGRRLEAASPDDPALEEFAATRLGRGAGEACR